jgi:8-oxo-dGTP pyrophosphatase MutT (NUDIX family)
MSQKLKNDAKKVQVVVLKGKHPIYQQNFQSKDEVEVLLMQTNIKRGGFWQNITGNHEDKDGALQITALRELDEETGLAPDDYGFFKLSLELEFIDQYNRNVTESCYGVYFDKEIEIIIDSNEHQGFKWISLFDLEESHYQYPSNYQVFQSFYKHLINLQE